jgi:predicted metalloprotease with PDZ domain
MSKPWYSRALAVCIVAACAVSGQAAEEKKGYLGAEVRKDEESNKILIIAVDDDGPAKRAGLEPGDAFLMLGEHKPTDLPTLVKFVQSLKPGTKLKVRVERGGQEKEYEVTIGAL